MTKQAIAGYPHKQRLRLNASRWGVVEEGGPIIQHSAPGVNTNNSSADQHIILPDSGNIGPSLVYFFFTPRVFLSKTTLPSSGLRKKSRKQSRKQSQKDLLSSSAPGVLIDSSGTEGGRVILKPVAAGAATEGAGAFRMARGAKKRVPVHVVRVAPGYTRLELAK